MAKRIPSRRRPMTKNGLCKHCGTEHHLLRQTCPACHMPTEFDKRNDYVVSR